MHKIYKSMSKGELKVHHGSICKALERAEPSKAPAELCKSEQNPEIELLKAEVETHKAKNEELKKSLDTVAEILTKLIKKTAPQGKAITSLEAIAKSEATEEKPLTKGEVTAILAKKAADSSLSKSDREAINAFYLSGATINSISHLLK